MEVIVASHPSALEHDTSRNHPERVERVGAVLEGVADTGLPMVEIVSPEIQRSELALVHDPSYIEMIETFCSLGGGALDMDTIVSRQSWDAALTAAGGVKALVEELEERDDATGFAVCRPPGHHALGDRAMGFCLFNNVAVTSALLRSRGQRVAILDWDVHHGNGTQALVIDDPGILYASVHQSPFYPFEGEIDDIDLGEAKGTTINVPLPRGAAGDVVRRAWGDIVVPVVDAFSPDWVLISAGYDGHVGDPLAEFRLTAFDYGWMARQLTEVHRPHRTVVALEGGYDLDALRESTRATLLGLSGVAVEEETLTSAAGVADALSRAHAAVSAHWAI